MRLQTLGTIQLLDGASRPLTGVLSQPKRTALFCFLAASHPPGLWSRDKLLAMFWPELGQDRARAALRQSLHYLRRAIGRDIFTTDGDAVGVAPDRLRVDAREFRIAADAGDAERALERYGGELLPGLFVSGAPAFDHWLEAERRELNRTAAAMASELSRSHEQEGDLVKAVRWAREATRLSPFEEVALRRVLTLLGRLGDRATAEQEYRTFVQRLRDDLEIEPSSDTERLAESLRGRATTGSTPVHSGDGAVSPSIAVLTFSEPRPARAALPLAEALADDLITDLTRFGLGVIARASSARIDPGTDAKEASRELDADYLLEGSIHRHGDRVRVNARLVDGREGVTVWADRFAGPEADLLEIHDALARRVLQVLRPSQQHGPFPSAAPACLEEFQYYHRARASFLRLTPAGLDEAVRISAEGIRELGPTELLLATLGMAHVHHIILGSRPNPDSLSQARRCVDRLFALDPASMPGRVLRGWVEFKSGNIEEAVRDLEVVRDREPSNRDALFLLVVIYIMSGRTAAAEPITADLLRVDPLTGMNHCFPGYIHVHRGEYQDALPYYDRTLEVEPANVPNRFLWVQLGIRAGQSRKALELAESVMAEMPGTPFAGHARVLKNALRGDAPGVRQAITPELAAAAHWDEHASWWIASALAMVGEIDQAVRWLENAVRLGFIDHPFLSRLDPCLERLRGTRSFDRLMDRVAERWERFQGVQ